jgi:hypothetical protein
LRRARPSGDRRHLLGSWIAIPNVQLAPAPGPVSTPEIRAALEVLLFSIGECINSAPEQTRAVYDLELPEWSKRLDYALLQLAQRAAHDSGETDAPAEAA